MICGYHVPGNKPCGKPAFEKYLSLWACPECIARYTAMWQWVGKLGIPVRCADPEKMIPTSIAEEIEKGKIEKNDQEFLRGCHVEPLS